MRRALLVLGLALAPACGPSEGRLPGDAAVRADARASENPPDSGTAPVDAAADTDAGAELGDHHVGPACVNGTAGLIVWVAEEYQTDSCYPEAGIESLILQVATDAPQPGMIIELGPDTGFAYVCPADQGQNCERFEEGQVTFRDYRYGVGAAGTISLRGGEIKVAFDASWCDGGLGCS